MSTRVIVVSRDEAGRPVGALLKAHMGLTWGEVRKLIQLNRVRQGPSLCRDAQCRARAGQKLRVSLQPTAKEKKAAAAPKSTPYPITFMDNDLVVVDKPAGLTTMRHAHEAAEFGTRGRRFLPTTLAESLARAFKANGDGRIIAVHRLDRDTSGLVVFARTAAAARQLGAQFRAHDAGRTYVALVRGKPFNGKIESWLVNDRGDGRRGSGPKGPAARRAVTLVRVLEELGDFALVECTLETGRTHQVRIHLGESGTPLCGEKIYDRPPHGAPAPDRSEAARPMLHAARLVLNHPINGRTLEFKAALPQDMATLLARLRKQTHVTPRSRRRASRS